LNQNPSNPNRGFMNKAVFLDKDGTLIEDVPYNCDPERIRLMPGGARALRLLHSRGFHLIVVSNQAGVARGVFPEKALQDVEARLHALFADAGVPLQGFYYCPHHPAGTVPNFTMTCRCRKPEPGLLLRAASKHGIDLVRSWMIGDILDDVEAGRRAGCRTVLIHNGHETEWRMSFKRWPEYWAQDLIEAAGHILTADRLRSEQGTCQGMP
jgi:D-glycero-D-manno-heptose 1,7-bisphosphate phosphatase